MTSPVPPPSEGVQIAQRSTETAVMGIEERIAEIHMTHTPRHENNGVDLWVACHCGNSVRYYDRRKHSAHVASVLVAELRLTKHFTWSWPNGSARGVPGYGFEVDTAQEAAEEAGGCTVVSRYVTPWTPA